MVSLSELWINRMNKLFLCAVSFHLVNAMKTKKAARDWTQLKAKPFQMLVSAYLISNIPR